MFYYWIKIEIKPYELSINYTFTVLLSQFIGLLLCLLLFPPSRIHMGLCHHSGSPPTDTHVSIHVYNWPPYLWSQATLLAKFQSSRIRKCIFQMTVWLSRRTYIFYNMNHGYQFQLSFWAGLAQRGCEGLSEYQDWDLMRNLVKPLK